MGNRVKGRVKRKSVKAASHSDMGSKRKLSRMGKNLKKGNAGLEATFIGRTKCLKKLQITLKDFRRLCILKGIYPREPLGRVPKNKKGQTFYHIKDIRAIAHEPVLEKFREFRAFMKKIRRAAGRNEKDEATRKNAVVPTYTLHHIVKERYPRFVDALSDLDDALTLIYLFAALPSEGSIKSTVTNKAKSLAASWGAFCATTHCITKSFISVKGIYFEASVRGTAVRWVIPHSFTQFLPQDVDYKVMQTFFEFHEVLLNFVLFKLYNDIGVRYPIPVTDAASQVKGSVSAILGANLLALKKALNFSGGAVTDVVKKSIKNAAGASNTDEKHMGTGTSKRSNESVKSVSDVLDKVSEENSDNDNDIEVDVDVAGPLKAAFDRMADDEANATVPGAVGGDATKDVEAIKRKGLFAGLTFFLSREVPRGYLELICLAYGAKVGWEGEDSPISSDDPSITHHIVDRPKLPKQYESLPKSREYCQPQWILDCANFLVLLPIAKYGVGVPLPPHLSPWVNDEEEGYKPAYSEEIERIKNGDPVDHAMEEVGSAEEKDNTSEATGSSKDANSEADNSETEESDQDEDEEEEEEKVETKKKSRTNKVDETQKLAKVMMSRKAAKLYGRMQHGLGEKQAKLDELHRRREEIDRKSAKEAGKTVSKQKVERLKKERKIVEKSYSSTGGSMKKRRKK